MLLAAAGVSVCAALLWNFVMSRRDRRRLDLFVQHSGDISFVASRGHQLAVRICKPPPGAPARANAVFIPNGMATTMTMIATLQEQLADAGFVTVCYDRYGCGLSDANAEGRSPTVAETVEDMRAVYDAAFPPVNVEAGERGRVILYGPSMGSIVAQCFVATHPGLASGFVNVDGVPHPFFGKRGLFQRCFGPVYKLESFMALAGVFRPMLALASSKLRFLTTPTGAPLGVIKALMNQPKFWANVGYEMKLMMDLCEHANDAWGPTFSMAAVKDAALREALMLAEPARCGREDDQTGEWVPLPAPLGTAPVPAAVVAQLRAARNDSVLAREWAQLVVYVLSARSYKGFGPFYPKDMQDWQQLEHAVQPLLAREGSPGRDVCPTLNHGQLFFNTLKTQLRRTIEVDDALQRG